MTRRSIFSTLAGFFVGKKVVEPAVTGIDPAFIAASAELPYADWVREGPSGPVGMPGPIGCCGHQGPCDCPKETEAEHAQRWADAEEWNRKFERNNV